MRKFFQIRIVVTDILSIINEKFSINECNKNVIRM